jgi:hypothetical protein
VIVGPPLSVVPGVVVVDPLFDVGAALPEAGAVTVTVTDLVID